MRVNTSSIYYTRILRIARAIVGLWGLDLNVYVGGLIKKTQSMILIPFEVDE